MRGVAREIVEIDRRHERAGGIVTDIQYGAPLSCPVASRPRYSDLEGAQPVLARGTR
jgi:hypothetical protein